MSRLKEKGKKVQREKICSSFRTASCNYLTKNSSCEKYCATSSEPNSTGRIVFVYERFLASSFQFSWKIPIPAKHIRLHMTRKYFQRTKSSTVSSSISRAIRGMYVNIKVGKYLKIFKRIYEISLHFVTQKLANVTIEKLLNHEFFRHAICLLTNENLYDLNPVN